MFLTTRTLPGSKFDVINQPTFLTQSFDVAHAVPVVNLHEQILFDKFHLNKNAFDQLKS
jgi:hypothetical protein